jgi:hypothetical protein
MLLSVPGSGQIPVNSVPYTIHKPGTYFLHKDLGSVSVYRLPEKPPRYFRTFKDNARMLGGFRSWYAISKRQ